MHHNSIAMNCIQGNFQGQNAGHSKILFIIGTGFTHIINTAKITHLTTIGRRNNSQNQACDAMVPILYTDQEAPELLPSLSVIIS